MDQKRFLFLDDVKIRHSQFDGICTRLPVSISVSHVWTVSQAINALRDQISPYDCAFLDHDLDQTDPEETGLTVAEFIALHMEPSCRPRNIVIHSHNASGAARMEAELRHGGVTRVKRVEFGANQ